MPPKRKNRCVKKPSFNADEFYSSKDGNNNKHKKRKLSDMLGFQWSKEDLARFYEAYRKFGKDWKKVASVCNRSVEMVEALYTMNEPYLSLPEGTASLVGLVATMTDHYSILPTESGKDVAKLDGSKEGAYEGSSRSMCADSARDKRYSIRCQRYALNQWKGNGKKTKVDGRGKSYLDHKKEAGKGTKGLTTGNTRGKVELEVADSEVLQSTPQGPRKGSRQVLFAGDDASAFDALQTLADLSLMMPHTTINDSASAFDALQTLADLSLMMPDTTNNDQSVQVRGEKIIDKSRLEVMPFDQRDKSQTAGLRGKSIPGVDGASHETSTLRKTSAPVVDVFSEAVAEPYCSETPKQRQKSTLKISRNGDLNVSHETSTPRKTSAPVVDVFSEAAAEPYCSETPKQRQKSTLKISRNGDLNVSHETSTLRKTSAPVVDVFSEAMAEPYCSETPKQRQKSTLKISGNGDLNVSHETSTLRKTSAPVVDVFSEAMAEPYCSETPTQRQKSTLKIPRNGDLTVSHPSDCQKDEELINISQMLRTKRYRNSIKAKRFWNSIKATSLTPVVNSNPKLGNATSSNSTLVGQEVPPLAPTPTPPPPATFPTHNPPLPAPSSIPPTAPMPSDHTPQTQTQPTAHLSANPSSTSYISAERESPRYWTIDVIDINDLVRQSRLTVKDVWLLPSGYRILVKFNEHGQPIGECGGILSGFLGHIASDVKMFPISYRSWKKVPRASKERCYYDVIKKKFHVDDAIGKSWIEGSIAKNWRENRCSLFREFYKPELSRVENIEQGPDWIPQEQWVAFIDYRLDPKTVAMAEQNTANRKKLKTPHTAGAKSFARWKHELETKRGQPMTRGSFWIEVHKTADRVYVDAETREFSDKIIDQEVQGSSTLIGQQDALGQVLGPEHPDRVGGSTTQQFSGLNLSADAATASREKMEQFETQLKAKDNEIKTLRNIVQYMFRAQFGDKTPPPEFASMLTP